MTRIFVYDEKTDEFVKTRFHDGGGNWVAVTDETRAGDGDVRYGVHIDDFGHVVAAFNRLVQRIVPTFQFPETKVPTDV